MKKWLYYFLVILIIATVSILYTKKKTTQSSLQSIPSYPLSHKKCAIPVAKPQFVYKPIVYNHERRLLTKEYRCKHYKQCDQSVVIHPQMIVLHWTADKQWKSTYNYFKQPQLGDRPTLKRASPLNVSSQYLVARNGTIYQLMPDNWMARHIIGLNDIAIGIENAGGVDTKQDLTPAQLASNVYLVYMLTCKYPSITYLIGHFEYGRFRNTPLWKETDPTYFSIKSDPGPIFMKSVREQVRQLHLKKQFN